MAAVIVSSERKKEREIVSGRQSKHDKRQIVSVISKAKTAGRFDR